MNKKQLIEAVAGKMTKSKSEAERAINAVLGAIKIGLEKDKEVQLIGFGSFAVRQRKARQGRNPKTGEPIKIKARNAIVFKSGKALKESVMEKDAGD